jgi:flagellar hook-length control protein FliK
MSLLDFINLLAGNTAPQPAQGAMPLLSAKLSALAQNQPVAGQNDPLAGLLQLIQSMVPQTAAPPPAQGATIPLLQQPQLLQLIQEQQATAPSAPAAAQLQGLLQQLQQVQEKSAAAPTPTQAQPIVPADIIKKLVALLQQQQAPSAIQPTLTSDLSAKTAPIVQEQGADDAKLEKQIRNLLAAVEQGGKPDNRLADLLNAIAPQSGTATPPVIDTKILAQLLTQMKDPDAHFTRDDAVQLLQDKGFDAPTVQQYISVLDKLTAPQDTAKPASAADTPPALPQADDTASAPAPRMSPQQSGQEQAKLQVQQRPLEIAQKDAQQAAPQQPAAQQQPQPKADTPQHISFINSLTRDDAEDMSGFSGGDQSGAELFGQNSGQASALISAPTAANAPGFINYMSAAGSTASSPTTQMVAVQLQMNAQAKTDTMTLQLSPSDLGRLDIKLKFDRDGGVRAHLSADKPETLALLRQDATHLQRALQQAGFDIDDNTLSFDLRHQSHQQNADGAQDNNRGQGKNSPYPNDLADGATLQAQLPVQAYGYISQGRVNIMV